jgi:hypothetical protein
VLLLRLLLLLLLLPCLQLEHKNWRAFNIGSK